MLERGCFITFEGSDGTGKSTQIEKTCEYIASKGFEVVLTREPGGTKISETIREILLDANNSEMFCETEALLYAAARTQHVRELIEPAVASGKVVVSDRYIDSSLAYQGYARHLGFDMIEKINQAASSRVMPDVTFLLMLPAGVAIERSRKTKEPDRIEMGGADFMGDVEDGYRILANKFPKRIVCIDASGGVEEVFDRIRAVLDKKIII
jgi:dTMP kinase